MTEYTWLAVYCTAVLIFSMCGGLLPFLGRVTHSRLQFYLSASAGVMLGASFFHVMPEAMALTKSNFGWWMSLGVVGMFCIERFIAPHSHELDGGGHHHHHNHHHHPHGHEHQGGGEHSHGHPHAPSPGHEHRAAAPAIAGWMAVMGLTIHTFMNGIALAGEVHENLSPEGLLRSPFPGFAIFLAIFLHKPADALAISMVLSRKGVSRRMLMLVQFGFAAMIPVGVVAFYLTSHAIEEEMRNELTGAALAFSAGTFLFIALSDLLPEVQFHRHDRIPLFLALALGVAMMGGIALLEGHDHGDDHGKPSAGSPKDKHHDHKNGPEKKTGGGHDHDKDDDKDHNKH
jgi:zinc and cadmium transporter